MDRDQNSALNSALEFWSLVALGLKDTAYIIFGDAEIDASRFNYRDAVYYGEL